MTTPTNEEYIKKNKTIVIDNDKNTQLHHSAANGNLVDVQAEIASGRKLDPENYLGWTPLMMAVRNNRMQVVELLLEAHADATKKNKFGMNIFLISITSGNLDMVIKILGHSLCGGVSRQTLQKTFSPLSLAILFSQNHIFKFLLQQSFDVNATTRRTGHTPLMFAAAMCNNKAIKRLIEKNADTSLRNYLNRTAQDIVITRNTSSIDIDMNVPQPITTQLPPTPLIVVPPYSPYYQLPPTQFRKSSNLPTPTPNFMANITPITPDGTICHQVFFPPDFSPSQYLVPEMAQRINANEFLNATVNPRFLSPFTSELYYSHYI